MYDAHRLDITPTQASKHHRVVVLLNTLPRLYAVVPCSHHQSYCSLVAYNSNANISVATPDHSILLLSLTPERRVVLYLNPTRFSHCSPCSLSANGQSDLIDPLVWLLSLDVSSSFPSPPFFFASGEISKVRSDLRSRFRPLIYLTSYPHTRC